MTDPPTDRGLADSATNEQLLAERLHQLARAAPGTDELVGVLGSFIRMAPDEALVRVNPARFADEHGRSKAEVVDLFLHARKVGLVTMEWQYVCPGCGEVVERLPSLTSATAHYYCQTCSAERDADLSDFIEVTFSVSPDVRRSRYHEPWSLDPAEHFFAYRFSQSATVDNGSSLREHIREVTAACSYIAPGATQTYRVEAQPGFVWLTNGPALAVGGEPTDEVRTFDFTYAGARSKGFRADIVPGPVDIVFTNATEEPYALLITRLPDHYGVTMGPFLSGAELLSSQTYLDLFETETIVAGEGLTVRRLTLLFTDLQGSTALYERIGDMRAFDLVRQHFGSLRASIVENSGALVKTIGDAVMASFVDPTDALRAALDMRTRVAGINADAGKVQLHLKVGVHSGACLAVTLNDRLDYFGQTVNTAARVQGLAGPGEIVVSEDVLRDPAAATQVERLGAEVTTVTLPGVAGAFRVHTIRPVSI